MTSALLLGTALALAAPQQGLAAAETAETTKLQGKTVALSGNKISVGDKAPAVTLTGKDLSNVMVGGKQEKVQVLVVVPSLDTPVCAMEAKKFNEKAAKLNNTTVTVISMDLPFAMGRFCTTEGIENVQVGSDVRNKDFAKAYGVLISEGALAGFTCRAIFVVDKGGKVTYKEIVPEVTTEPDYDAALAAAKKANS